ncbi:hypothetical protein K0C01_02695 [Salinarchaeum sp. IM2453]|uniref:hypothetical protein n=1 Tax=Salinarchaeum sp. IM2453 TaxID=2862870 RepID=UPI001C82B534|nr:hypothetical protein [Salinarchaeum sp. IM2453]QZA89082.1 hypothetical protein K0C01_02695 [Salinarchaeum sp. IM2453]
MYRDIGLVAGGSWDQSDQKFCEETIYDSPEPHITVYSGLRSRFENGKPWEQTEFIQHILDRLEDEQSVWHGCKSKQDVLSRCAKLDKLYNIIKENGYQSRRELLNEDNDHLRYTPKLNPMRFYYKYDEVVCNLGRDGEFLFVGGHHRLSIAKILDIDRIPVRIFVRHKEWQQKLDRHSEEKTNENFGHPDLKNL